MAEGKIDYLVEFDEEGKNKSPDEGTICDAAKRNENSTEICPNCHKTVRESATEGSEFDEPTRQQPQKLTELLGGASGGGRANSDSVKIEADVGARDVNREELNVNNHRENESDDENDECHNKKFWSKSSSSGSSNKMKKAFKMKKGETEEDKKTLHRQILCYGVIDILFGCPGIPLLCIGCVPVILGGCAIFNECREKPQTKKAKKQAKCGFIWAMIVTVFVVVNNVLFISFMSSPLW